MRHTMRLNNEPFEKIYSGKKTIELRLYDEKRRKISVGDEIKFIHSSYEGFFVIAEVIQIHKFDSFQELYEKLPLLKCGYTEETVKTALPDDMDKYYSKKKQKEYGVVGIEFKILKKPFRDVYRFAPFLKEIENLWKLHPDWRFGQLITNFEYWVRDKGICDLYYVEEDRFLELFKEFIYGR